MPGSRLPSERDLALQLGVSRPSVREALIVLEIAGFVEVRMGSGIFVCSADTKLMLLPDETVGPGPFELVAARRIIEGENCALAAYMADDASLDYIAETIEMMNTEFKETSKAFEADRLFHIRIAEATGNSALAHVVRDLWDLRRGPMYKQFESHFDTRKRHAQAIKEHGCIMSALRRRDAEGARTAMHDHLDAVKQAFTIRLDDPSSES